MSKDPADDREDARTAAGMQASISSFVLTAALAIIAAEAAIVVFFFDKRNISIFGVFMLILCPVLVIASFIAGGQGLNQLSKNGYAGDWQITRVGGLFNWQAILTLAAALCLLCSVMGVSPKPPEGSNETKSLSDEVSALRTEVRALESKLRSPSTATRPKIHRP